MKTTTSLALSLITLSLLMSGCASNRNYKKAEHTSNSLENTAKVIHQSHLQVGVVTKTLGDLVESPKSNIQPQFVKFDAELTKLTSLATHMNEQSASIQTEGKDYFKSWDEDLTRINNEDIRSRSTERKHIMAASFEKVRINYEKAKGDLARFLSDLKDIRTALASDLTAGGLESVKETTEDSEYQAQQLQKVLKRMENDFQDLSASMSTTTTTGNKIFWTPIQFSHPSELVML